MKHVIKKRNEATHWHELSRLRWGPAVGDDAPGIIIDAPDRARMRAALDAAAIAPDAYAIAERAAIRAEAEDPFAHLVGRFTPWKTICWSDPAAPEIEAFGAPPRERRHVEEPATPR